MSTSFFQQTQTSPMDSPDSSADAPVIQWVNTLLSDAISRGANAIHIEPYEKKLRVRMRMDGILHEAAQIPIEMKRAIIARIKSLARMNLAETTIPQDGRIRLKASGKEIDFRANTMPTLFGEKIALHLLNQGGFKTDLMTLGFEPKQLEQFKKGIYSPSGMVLVTGPTGSGKTTTLYSSISELNQITDTIFTLEDPVEYPMEGINQIQFNPEKQLSFASTLRSLFKQDPDIILVGELRDRETTELGIHAALGGRLILSTLHTQDAVSTVTRLVSMGIEPFLISASVKTIAAQRLIRKNCPRCRMEDPVSREKLIDLGFAADLISQIRCTKGKGCNFCNGTGYKGRVAVYEVLELSRTFREMIIKQHSAAELKHQAINEGMKPLRAAALTKMAEGITSLEEALSATLEN